MTEEQILEQIKKLEDNKVQLAGEFQYLIGKLDGKIETLRELLKPKEESKDD